MYGYTIGILHYYIFVTSTVSEPVGTREAKNTTTYQMSTLLPLLVITRATTTTTTPTFDDIPWEVLTQHIIPFIGSHQYCFVASVNQKFHTAYVKVFPRKLTYYNVSTVQHAKFCVEMSAFHRM
jgi:hypothetical protein